MSPYICAFYLFYVHAFTKSSPAGRIQVCLTVRIKFTGVPAETAVEISFQRFILGGDFVSPWRSAQSGTKIWFVRFALLNSLVTTILLITCYCYPILNQPLLVKENTNEEIGDTKRTLQIQKRTAWISRAGWRIEKQLRWKASVIRNRFLKKFYGKRIL